MKLKLKLRLIWRKSLADSNGAFAEYIYKTDDVVLPEDAQAFQFPDVEGRGWMPELVGGEWINKEERASETIDTDKHGWMPELVDGEWINKVERANETNS